MRDILAPRLRLGIIAPSTNTIVETEMSSMRPPGIGNHFAGILVKNSPVAGSDAFSQLMRDIRAAMDAAIENVVTAQPDRVILGISSESLWGGSRPVAGSTTRCRRSPEALLSPRPVRPSASPSVRCTGFGESPS